MFVIGREYQFRTFEDNEQWTWLGVVVEHDPPLLKVKKGQEGDLIINTSSIGFISAEPAESLKARGDEQRKTWEKLADD